MRCAGTWLWLPCFLILPCMAVAQIAITAVPQQSFSIKNEPHLRMPTDCAVDSAGRVFVADGVNDRVVCFAPDGSLDHVISAVGSVALARPAGVAIDSQDRLYIADSGNARVVRPGPEDAAWTIPAAAAGASAEPTDVLPLEGGMWVVDNTGHRLLLGRPSQPTGNALTWSAHGTYGERLGDWQYPFLIAAGAGGDLLVSDVINARIGVIDQHGRAVATISRFGLAAGELYRPKGVAADRAARVWVSDSVTGVVQAFSRSGEFIGAIHNTGGEVLRLQQPMGMCFDLAGALYVVELGADRVQKFEIQIDERSATPRSLPRQRVGAGNQARSCTVCHITWAPEYTQASQAAPLVPAPPDSLENPAVSSPQMCLSCHDGAVADSRRSVWLEHGHEPGVTPSESIRVPNELPLVKGTLQCRTCHSAHGPGVAQSDIARTVMLRVTASAGELCLRCHTNVDPARVEGSHPLPQHFGALPQALLHAGARPDPGAHQLTCTACHTPHGGADRRMLVMSDADNQLCTSCHAQMNPVAFGESAFLHHPLQGSLSRREPLQLSGSSGASAQEETLRCGSCHRMHHAPEPKHLLAATRKDDALCTTCHDGYASILPTPHNLSRSCPSETNLDGRTVAQAGACSACHMVHQPARNPLPTAFDAAGMCTSCHATGQCAESALLRSPNHPGETCVACHNPHANSFGDFLRAPATELCTSCHAQQATLAGAAHDPRSAPWSTRATAHGSQREDLCLACHRPHGDADHGLWRVAPVDAGSGSDGACIACHADAGWDLSLARAALHPNTTTRAGEPGAVQCASCHNAHAPPDAAAPLLRAVSGQSQQACTACHTTQRTISNTPHAAATLASKGLHATACAPCHTAHALPRWPSVTMGANQGAALQANRTIAAGDCSQCHAPGAVATSPAVATHPLVPMFDPYGKASPLPLFNPAGEPGSQGTVACQTCHLPHGRPELAGNTRSDNMVAVRPLLRPFSLPNACSACHGEAARSKFMYFHDLQQRKLR